MVLVDLECTRLHLLHNVCEKFSDLNSFVGGPSFEIVQVLESLPGRNLFI